MKNRTGVMQGPLLLPLSPPTLSADSNVHGSRSMALQLAFDKGSDSHAVTLLTTLFPATFGSLRESHIRYFGKQEASKNVPKAEYRRGNTIICLSLFSITILWTRELL